MGDLSKCFSREKIRSTIFVSIFLTTAVAMVSTGAAMVVIFFQYFNFLNVLFFVEEILLIAIGCVLIILTPIGYTAYSKKRIRTLQIVSKVFLIIVLIFEIPTIVLGFLLAVLSFVFIEHDLSELLKPYEFGGTILPAWDYIQRNFRCCGKFGFEDWNPRNKPNYTIPVACCDFSSANGGDLECNEESEGLYDVGCLSAFGEYVESLIYIMTAVILTSFIIQFVLIVTSGHIAGKKKVIIPVSKES